MKSSLKQLKAAGHASNDEAIGRMLELSDPGPKVDISSAKFTKVIPFASSPQSDTVRVPTLD